MSANPAPRPASKTKMIWIGADMNRLPAILARDYARNAAWPYVLVALSLTVLTGVAGGMVSAADILGW